jgi:hypothetical protein
VEGAAFRKARRKNNDRDFKVQAERPGIREKTHRRKVFGDLKRSLAAMSFFARGEHEIGAGPEKQVEF